MSVIGFPLWTSHPPCTHRTPRTTTTHEFDLFQDFEHVWRGRYQIGIRQHIAFHPFIPPDVSNDEAFKVSDESRLSYLLGWNDLPRRWTECVDSESLIAHMRMIIINKDTCQAFFLSRGRKSAGCLSTARASIFFSLIRRRRMRCHSS